MNYQRLKRDKEIKALLCACAEYLRYTFTPAISLLVLVCGFGALAIMTIMFYRFQPLLAAGIFCGYAGFLFVVMVASFNRWRRYKMFNHK